MWIPLVFLIVFLANAVRLALRGHLLCGALVGLGALGFFGAALLPTTGVWLRSVELPPFFETSSIVGPEGRTFTATIPLARIQRYDGNGHFETGWFVDSAGGAFSIGMTVDGRIAVAAARTKRVEFFNPDGSSVGPPRPFISSGGLTNGVLRPSNGWIEGVAIADPIQVRNPGVHWSTLMLFPLWNPFVAWLLVVLGMVGMWATRKQGQPAERPLS